MYLNINLNYGIINKQGYFGTEKNNKIPGQFIESDDLDFFFKKLYC